MKYALLFSLCFIKIYPVFAEVVSNKSVALTNAEDLRFTTENNLETVYLKSGDLFSGAVKISDGEGRKITYFYRDGLRNGVATSNYEDGKLELEITYRKGQKNGEEISFYENGNPEYKKTYKDDVLNGEEIIFYENGQPKQRNNYLNGVLDGEITYFAENGNRTKIEHYKNGQKDGIEHIISDNILREENNYIAGKLTGVTKKYNDKYLIEEINYVDGKKDGVSKQYKEDGSVIEIPYKNNKKSGTAHAYYPDKKIANKVDYFNDEKNGISERYYKNGKKQIVETYKNGRLEGVSRRFSSRGDLQSVSYYVQGTELAKVDIENNSELKEIQAAHRLGQLSKFSARKNLWYPILWLGINSEDLGMLQILEKEMKMYGATIDDVAVYKRESKTKFDDYNRRLFFGLSPLSYAVDLSAPVEILQLFAAQNHIDEPNNRGGTALQEAIRLNNLEMTKFLLAHHANVKNLYDGAIVPQAVREDVNIYLIAELLKFGADVNAKLPDGNTALGMALQQNDEDLAELLLKNKADTQTTFADGNNLLFFAVENNSSVQIIDKLLAGGADVNQKKSDGSVLLLTVLAEKKYDLAEKFMTAGADVNLADSSGDSAVTYVLENPTDEKIIQQIYAQDIDVKNLVGKKQQPLWRLAAEHQRWDLLDVIFAKMGGVNVADTQGNVPLQTILPPDAGQDAQLTELILSHISPKWLNDNSDYLWSVLEYKNFPLWQRLLKIGFNPEVKNNKGDTLALWLIKNKYDLSWLKSLESLKPDLNVFDSASKTPLYYAIKNDDALLMQNLLQNGADINLPQTAYLFDLSGNQTEATQILLLKGGDYFIKSETPQNLLFFAVESFNPTLLDYLVQNGIDVNLRDADGNEAIHHLTEAVQRNSAQSDEEIVRNFTAILDSLLQGGANINVQNGNGDTLLMRLAEIKTPLYSKLAELLKNKGINVELKNQYGKTAADLL